MEQKLRERCLKIIIRFFGIFKIRQNKIVITNFYGKGFGDSAKNVVEELHARNNDYDIVWLTSGHLELFPEYVRPIRYKSLRAIYELATARMWVDNSRKRKYIHKRSGQRYLQMWHGNLRMKKIEKDAEDYLSREYIESAKNDSKMADAMIAGCDFSYNTIRNSFWYDGPIYKTGIPRCDELFNISPKEIKKTKDKLGIKKDEKVFLYAPTFRKSGDIDLSKIDHLSSKLDKAFGDKHKLLVRFHPISKQTIKETERLINTTSYPNMQELINAADVLITDYSGSMFDAIIAHKPCILFTPDYEEYIKNERALYFDFEDLPFVNTHTFNDLADAIIDFKKKDYDKKADAFLKKIGNYEKGESTKNVADLIEKMINE